LAGSLVARFIRADWLCRYFHMFWLQAVTFIPKARPMRATFPPTLPKPSTLGAPAPEFATDRSRSAVVADRVTLADDVARAGQNVHRNAAAAIGK
jgi:hypothetical protein